MKKQRENVSNADRLNKGPALKVFGIGGAGCNAVEHIDYRDDLHGE